LQRGLVNDAARSWVKAITATQNLTVWQDQHPKYQSRFPRQEKKFSCLKLTYLESKRKKQRKISLKNCTMMAVCPQRICPITPLISL
jgi:hypothetical protein